jgi:radical SAM family uncharacterized protein/radical SAM-linked protein
MPAFIPTAAAVAAGSRAWAAGGAPVSHAPRRARAAASTPARCAPAAVLAEPAAGGGGGGGAPARSPSPGEASGAFRPEDWEGAERDEALGNAAWDALRELLPYTELRKIGKASQYLGNELGAVHPDWDAADVRFVLAYPDLYSIGMSSTGHVVLYSCLNDAGEGLLCDRAYLPGLDMQAALERAGKSVFAVESKRPLVDFHVVGMSISYELCATNCLKMMELGHIPTTWEARDAAVGGGGGRFLDGPPLVFAGGLSVTANPEPYAAFFDFFALGDGEVSLPAIGRKVKQVLAERPDVSREEITLILARDVPGVYAPRFYDMDPASGSVRRNRPDVPARPRRQNAMPEPWRAMALVPHTDAVHDRLSIEVRRGCTRGCRFCLPGMVQRPARDVEPDRVVEAVRRGVERTGYNEFSLLSLSCSDWLSLPAVGLRLKNELADHNISLSLGSQRVDRFDENIARVAGGLRKSGLTFAPEAGTQRMRDVINKGLTDAELLRGVVTAYEQGWQSVKLYFLIGLPAETDADVMGIANTIRCLQRRCRAPGRRRLALTVTISNFTPKPWTPFQWHTVSADDFRRKQRMLRREFQFVRDVKLNFTDTRLSSMEEFIGRGDRRMGGIIARAHELGAGMDGWFESMEKAYGAWCQAIDDCGLSWKYRLAEKGEWNVAETPEEEVRGKRGWRDVAKAGGLDRKTLLAKGDPAVAAAAGPRSALDRELPWDHIDVGLDKGWLRDELMRALDGALTPDCAFHDCSQCGCCGDEFGNNVTIPPPPVPEYRGESSPPSDRAQRIRLGFARRGAMSMSSHLDTARMLDRLLRRAGLPISFNEGFHPHARIVTSSALPFGATADGELIDFFLHAPVPVGEFAARVDAALPDGMRVSSATELDVVATTTSILMESADYALALYRETDGDAAVDWDAVVSRILASGPVPVDKTTKRGGSTTRDLREMVLDVRMATAAEAAPVLAHVGAAGWPAGGAVVHARLALTNQGALGPEGFVRLAQLAAGDEELTLLHAHRARINPREDERYARVRVIRQFEAGRRAAKPRVNRWARMRVAAAALNEPWMYR